MSGMLASPRRRRRLAWGAGLAILLAVVVPLAIKYSNTGVKEEAAGGPTLRFEPEPQQVPLTPKNRDTALAVAARFLQTAVARKDLDASWQLVAPSLKGGLTRDEWRTGNIPVVPYPVDYAKWKRDYSYPDRIGLKVALFPSPGAKVKPVVFDIDLVAAGTGTHRRWLVDEWTPAGGSGLADLIAGSGSTGRAGLPNLAGQGGASRLSGAWLLAPLLLIGGTILLLPVCVGCRHWYLGRRARRDYARERAARAARVSS